MTTQNKKATIQDMAKYLIKNSCWYWRGDSTLYADINEDGKVIYYAIWRGYETDEFSSLKELCDNHGTVIDCFPNLSELSG